MGNFCENFGKYLKWFWKKFEENIEEALIIICPKLSWYIKNM